MAFDGIFTRAMANELNELLLDGRVMKISQPYANEVILTIRQNRHNYPVLLSAHPNYARVQVTEIPYTNPPIPTNFTMVLRKYLEGAKLVKLEQLNCDRVLNFYFMTRNELGDRLPLILSVEIMGRYSNIILVEQETNKILDTVKHVGMDQNRYRTLLPGATYKNPPAQTKRDPFSDQDKLYLELVKDYPNREVLAMQLVKTYQGLSRQSALQLAKMLHEERDLSTSFNAFLEQTKHPKANIFTEKNKLAFDIFTHHTTQQEFATLSEMLDSYYQEKAVRDRVFHQGAKLIHIVKKELSKNQTKLKKLTKELKNTDKADGLRVKGELLTTYLYQVKPNATSVTLPNYYDGEKPVKITLSPQLSPAQNSQKYFKKYQKLKNAVAHIEQQLALTKAEIAYLESVQMQLELAQPSDLNDIELELQTAGYLTQTKQQKKRKPKLSKPETFVATDGTEISVGKNNLQNDRLSLKTAQKNHYWLHVKDIPGSHVIVHSSQPTQETLLQAASLAAYYSKARGSANVPVDYVQVRHLRKPNGAKPGFVIYEGQKTLYVTPDKALVAKLKN